MGKGVVLVVDRRPWLGAGVVCALAFAGCNEARTPEPSTPEIDEDGSTSGAGGGDGDGDGDGDSGEEMVVVIPEDPSCLLSAPYAGLLQAPCPDVALDGTSCVPGDATCAYYPAAAAPSSPGVACVSHCDLTGARPVWSVDCYTHCNHACREPDPETIVTDLDTSDCAVRELRPCPDGALTLQDELDRMLRDELSDAMVPLGEINEDRLFVDFVDGCPSRFYPGRTNFRLAGMGPLVAERLRSARWACAMELGCAQLEGPSTIASQ